MWLQRQFFSVCNIVTEVVNHHGKACMNWQDIKTLKQQGHDIEFHAMTHINLNMKSQQELVYELGRTKRCILDHGINSTVFAYPASTRHKNAT